MSALVFFAKAAVLRRGRSLSNLRTGLHRFARGNQTDYAVLLAQSRTPLWTAEGAVEEALQFGKVENLRNACASLHLAEVPVGETFSFWKQVGRAKKSRGYIKGRELRQGCLIPSVGGGLCQLSNALYDAALTCGCKIVERHAHTAVVPGSAAENGRDATVFWNYVDFRFIPTQDLLITASLSGDELLVGFWGKQALLSIQAHALASETRASQPVNTCTDCGMVDCFRHIKNGGPRHRGHRAFLIEECWPEFDEFCRQERSGTDQLLLPWHWNRLAPLHRYRWNSEGYRNVTGANLRTILSSVQSKFRLVESLPPIAIQVRRSRNLADCYAARLSSSASFLYVAQTLLPFIWRCGSLGGRRFAVLMTRLPLRLLHSRLDQLARQFPEQKSFQEFRAPDWMVEAEMEALEQAESIVTPHTLLAGLLPRKTQKLPWKLPKVKAADHGDLIVFPGPTVARKGAYQLREAMRGSNEKLLLLGNNLESETFWEGVNASRLQKGEDWLQQVSLVVQPAFIENAPRPLLRALAAGIPVIATPECGLDAHPNLTLVQAGDAVELRRILNQAFLIRSNF
ncbi:MAG TPA: VanW family protein [Candidatus Angelobacter sp.]